MKRIIIIAASFMGLGICTANAQQIPMFNSYILNRFLINPSYAGTEGKTNIYGLNRLQFAGFQDAPVTYMLSADADFGKRNFGLGGLVFSDRNKIISQTGFQATYSFNIKLSEDWRLGMGLNAGMVQWALNFDQLRVEDPSENILIDARTNATTFRSDFGFRVASSRFDFGVAIPQFVTSKVNYTNYLKNTNGKFTTNPHFLVNLGYNFSFAGDVWNFKPTVLMRTAKDIKPQVDAIGVFDWKRRAYISAGYRSNFALSVGGGLRFGNGLTMGYNFDRPTNDIKKYSAGSHELVLGISFGQGSKPTEAAYQMSKEDREVLEAMKQSDIEKEKRISEMEKQLRDFDEQNRAQQEELEKFRSLLKDNDAEMEKLKNSQRDQFEKAKDQPESKNKSQSASVGQFIIVLGAFKTMEESQAYQKILDRTGEAPNAQILKQPDGPWYFIYEEAYDKKEVAQKRLNYISKHRTEVPKIPWIYVNKG